MAKSIIEVTLPSKEDYLNKFHSNKISFELSDYILSECKAIHPNDSLEIHITCDFPISKEEQKNLIDMIRENYGTDIHEMYILVEKTKIINLLAFLMGIIFLFINLFVNFIPVVSEIILIFGWVLIWESIYNILYGGLKNRLMIHRLKRLTSCKIYFKENKK